MIRRLAIPALAVAGSLAGFLAGFPAGCGPARNPPAANPRASGPPPHHAYVWQREWTPAVSAAVAEGRKRLDGLVVLAAEIDWRHGRGRVAAPRIDWLALDPAGGPIALAVRVQPWPGPFAPDDKPARLVIAAAKQSLDAAAAHGANVSELQIDFDCADRKLAGYAVWIRELREAVRPARLVFTALPSWLEQPEFPALAAAADAFVLQVHSIDLTPGGHQPAVCDAAMAAAWVERAGRIGRPFDVALPTYRCLAGYDAAGRRIGVVTDGTAPAWPPGTRVIELASDPAALASLVARWKSDRPAAMRRLLWYRLPVAADRRNWRWQTLGAVIDGRRPAARIEARVSAGATADVTLVNTGETDEPAHGRVEIAWDGPAPAASDALAQWRLETGPGRAVFLAVPDSLAPVIVSGESRSIGWLRFAASPPSAFNVTVHP